MQAAVVVAAAVQLQLLVAAELVAGAIRAVPHPSDLPVAQILAVVVVGLDTLQVQLVQAEMAALAVLGML
jgi:hypothetical protein